MVFEGLTLQIVSQCILCGLECTTCPSPLKLWDQMEAGDLSLHGPGLCGSLHTNNLGTDFTLLTEGRLGFALGKWGVGV